MTCKPVKIAIPEFRFSEHRISISACSISILMQNAGTFLGHRYSLWVQNLDFLSAEYAFSEFRNSMFDLLTTKFPFLNTESGGSAILVVVYI